MTRYSWRPFFRFVPTDGIVETLDLALAVGRPKSIDAQHDPEITERTDINRRGATTIWGFRPKCKMSLEVFDTSMHATVATIASRLADPGWRVYLSLDGGTTYREVEGTSKLYDGPKAIGGKTHVGAEVSLEMRGVDLLESPPALGLGVW